MRHAGAGAVRHHVTRDGIVGNEQQAADAARIVDRDADRLGAQIRMFHGVFVGLDVRQRDGLEAETLQQARASARCAA